MLLQLVVFFAAATATTTAFAVLGGIRRTIWTGLPLGLLALALAGAVIWLFFQDQGVAIALVAAGAAIALLTRLLFRSWSWLGAQLFAAVVMGGLSYLVYAAVLTFTEDLGIAGTLFSVLLLVLEFLALTLSASYILEIVDVLSRNTRLKHRSDPAYQPKVALQVPAYNEPVEVVGETLRALARSDYPNLLVQVVDNNTEDPDVWRPLEALCKELGPRFQFMHLEKWPGFKAGALNEATRRLPADVELVGIVDADYLVDPDFPAAVAGHFADPNVAFAQTPQDYRDWRDDGYLRGLYYSYLYFFRITMPARANRNAIIFAGTMGLIRRQALEEIGGWNTECVTEDAEASLRMLGHGYEGVYDPHAYGRGLMPLSFDGLKKQRFRWALGGIQILRLHWRDLFGPGGKLRLTAAQRFHYLAGSLQWFGDLMMAVFTLLLLITAVATVLHHQLPVRRLTGAVLVVPLVFLATGLLRALWAMRATTGASWSDAFRALQVWFALSWVVSLACLKGLLGSETAFLRTPKRREGESGWLQALRAARTETLISGAGLLAAVGMVIASPYPSTLALAVLLTFQSLTYANASWAGVKAEGIELTPLRKRYLASSQNVGDWPEAGPGPGAYLSLIAIVGAIVVALAVLGSPASAPARPSEPLLPVIGKPPPGIAQPAASPSPEPTPKATSPPPSPLPSPTASPTR